MSLLESPSLAKPRRFGRYWVYASPSYVRIRRRRSYRGFALALVFLVLSLAFLLGPAGRAADWWEIAFAGVFVSGAIGGVYEALQNHALLRLDMALGKARVRYRWVERPMSFSAVARISYQENSRSTDSHTVYSLLLRVTEQAKPLPLRFSSWQTRAELLGYLEKALEGSGIVLELQE